MKAEPFLYWRYASMGIFALGMLFAFIEPQYPSLIGMCAIMAFAWALCDVVAWRDYRKFKKEEDEIISP